MKKKRSDFLCPRVRNMLLASVIFAGLRQSQTAQAVPASMLTQPSSTQADVEWARLESDRFIIYYDSSQKTLATHALKSLEKAYPDYSLLLGATLNGQSKPPELMPEQVLVSNFEKIPVIISARSDGASFANLISQSLEIQSTESPPSSLFQHELAHRIMYEHMDLNVGPAGRTFMLAMLPSWWTEGLPEYLTESLGRVETNGFLRAMALNDTFLSWDRLHALYKASGDASVRGYAISGRFFKYFLERTPTKSLLDLHRKLTWKQLIPPFFTGAYFVIHDLTGQWPGDLYESFKKDLKKNILEDLQGMPRLEKIPGVTQVFSSGGNSSFAINEKTFIQPDFSTDSREGGLEVYRFSDRTKKKLLKSSLLPLKIKSDDRVVLHPKEWTDGGFWTTSIVKANNRTAGQLVSYYSFNGSLDSLKDEDVIGRVDFPLGADANPPIVRRIVSTSPENAAVLTTLNTESKLYLLNKKLRQHTLLGQWRAPQTLALVRPHHAYSHNESALCANVIVNSEDERTSIERLCHGEAPQTIIPEGQFYIRDAIMLAPDDFILLTSWHDIQAIVRWTKNGSELIAGLPDFVTSIEPAESAETIMMRVNTGGNTELWRAPLADLKRAHLGWIVQKPESSKWWTPPSFTPYVPPFARYAQEIRKSSPAVKVQKSTTHLPIIPKSESTARLLAQADLDQTTTEDKPKIEETQNSQILPAQKEADDDNSVVIPAPYRFRHWMTYPNTLPPFLAGVWTFGFFSRPMVDEMERFYLQLFGAYYLDQDIATNDRLSLEANLVGNRLFDGWKANVFMRPRFNGLTDCKFRGDPKIYVCQLYLRESGGDLQLNRRLISTDATTDVHARLFQITPSSRGAALGAPSLGAQTALLLSGGGSLAMDTWNKVLFDKPVTDLSKRSISLGGTVRFGVDSTHSIGEAKAGNDTVVSPVSFQNYSFEFTNSASYRDQSLTLRNSYSSTGGGAPLNAKEFFRPFKTYIIGANDGLQDISTALAGNGLLSYNLIGRAQYRNSLSYSFPIVRSLDTRFALAYLEKLDGEIVLSRGGTSDDFLMRNTNSISTITGSVRLKIDVKGYQFNPSILYGQGIDKPLWQLFTQIKFDQFW